MSSDGVFSLPRYPVHVGLGGTLAVQPEYTGELAWYESYEGRTRADGRDGRLVAMHTFSSSWGSWEMHPQGEELVLCVAGRMTLIQELDGGLRELTLEAGDAAINPAGVWHTADVEGEATALFITAGLGTEHRPR